MSDLVEVTKRELEQWPGATARFSKGGKHQQATLTFAGKSRKVIFALTPSDSVRGTHNHLAEVRRALKAMGAAKMKAAKSDKPKRQRNKPVRAPVHSAERAPVFANPFDALADIVIPTPRRTLWQRIVGWFK